MNDSPLKALVIAGTSDARELCIRASKANIVPTAAVATWEATASYREIGIKVHTGRMKALGMTDLAMKENLKVIIDASHPFANMASEEAIKTSLILKIPYIRYERPAINSPPDYFDRNLQPKMLFYADDAEDAVKVIDDFIKRLRDNTPFILPNKPLLTIFLATGSKTLETFAKALLPQKKIRLVVRFLPRKENLTLCEKLGIKSENIIAMQGPYSKELNKIMLKDCEAGLLVTKESGTEGSVVEKLGAAAALEIPVVLIRRPKVSYPNLCNSIDEAIELASILAREGASRNSANKKSAIQEKSTQKNKK